MELRTATADDVAAIARLRHDAALELTRRHGEGRWSSPGSERSVVSQLRHSGLRVAVDDGTIVGSLMLAARKPWAIDPAYFTAVTRPLHLTDMVVDPTRQRRGIGRWMLDALAEVARAEGAGAIRLDAWDAPAGAGEFYRRCGYVERGRVVYRGAGLVYYERVVSHEA